MKEDKKDELIEKLKEFIEYLEKGFIRRDDQREFRAEITALETQIEEQESKPKDCFSCAMFGVTICPNCFEHSMWTAKEEQEKDL